MLLKDYLADIHAVIAECTQTHVIVSSDIVTDFRTDNIGLLRGTVGFLDGSTLFSKSILISALPLIKRCIHFIIRTLKRLCDFDMIMPNINLLLAFRITNIPLKKLLRHRFPICRTY